MTLTKADSNPATHASARYEDHDDHQPSPQNRHTIGAKSLHNARPVASTTGTDYPVDLLVSQAIRPAYGRLLPDLIS